MANSYELTQRLYGWRGKIGLLVPSINFATEFELNKLAPQGVSICASRLKVNGDLNSVQEIIRISEEETGKAAKEVADAKVDLIIYGCTTGSFIRGIGYDKKLIERIERLTSIPAITTSTSVIEALKELEMKNVALVTPYNEEVNKLEEKFLSDNGFNVTNLVGGNLKADQMLSSIAYKRAKIADTPKSDGIFISCCSFQTINILKMLESDLAKPAISSNQATMWYALKKLKIRDAIVGYGTLLNNSR